MGKSGEKTQRRCLRSITIVKLHLVSRQIISTEISCKQSLCVSSGIVCEINRSGRGDLKTELWVHPAQFALHNCRFNAPHCPSIAEPKEELVEIFKLVFSCVQTMINVPRHCPVPRLTYMASLQTFCVYFKICFWLSRHKDLSVLYRAPWAPFHTVKEGYNNPRLLSVATLITRKNRKFSSFGNECSVYTCWTSPVSDRGSETLKGGSLLCMVQSSYTPPPAQNSSPRIVSGERSLYS